MQLGKWGNSLAFRMPRKLIEELQLKEGDTIDSARIEAAFRDEQAAEIAARRQVALEEIGKGRFTLPPDWKFDRDEANWRPAMDRW